MYPQTISDLKFWLKALINNNQLKNNNNNYYSQAKQFQKAAAVVVIDLNSKTDQNLKIQALQREKHCSLRI